MNNRNVVDPEFNKAMQLHQLGILPDAVRLYQSVLTRTPDHSQALNMLGLAYAQLGNLPQAASLIQRALAIQPDIEGAHGNLGFILQSLNRNEEALSHLEAALAAAPNDPDALNALAATLSNLGRFEEAIPRIRQVLAINPAHAGAQFNLGNAMTALQRPEEAIACYQEAVRHGPELFQAHLNLGNVLMKQERYDEAIEHYEKALAGAPGNAEVIINLCVAYQMIGRSEEAIAKLRAVIAAHTDNANAHQKLGNALSAAARFDEAVESYRAALARDPKLVDAQVGLGNALVALDRYEEAIEQLQAALALQSDNIDAEINLGIALGRILRTDEAITHHRRALDIDPAHAVAHKTLGLMYMELGRLAEGGPHHERRWEQDDIRKAMRSYSQPRWRGEQVPGTLLVWGEHGLGDEILYAGLIEDLRKRCSSLVLEVEPRLVALFQRSFPDVTVVARGEALYSGAIDAHSPAGSLAQYLRPDRDAFPRDPVPFLRADEARTRDLRKRLTTDSRPVVGVSWRSGNPIAGKSKTAQLREFAALLRLPDVRFVDLQYGETAAERDAVEQELGVRVERLDDIDNTNDIDGLAALMAACDAVVSVSSTTVHLAGALGRPTWVMTPFGHGRIWYWFRDGDQSPWYPRVYVRRQALGQSWADLMPGVTSQVAALLGRT